MARTRCWSLNCHCMWTRFRETRVATLDPFNSRIQMESEKKRESGSILPSRDPEGATVDPFFSWIQRERASQSGSNLLSQDPVGSTVNLFYSWIQSERARVDPVSSHTINLKPQQIPFMVGSREGEPEWSQSPLKGSIIILLHTKWKGTFYISKNRNNSSKG